MATNTRMTRGRALQEITNVENDVEKPPAKKQRSEPIIIESAAKPATRLTRRKSLEKMNSNSASSSPLSSSSSSQPTKSTTSQPTKSKAKTKATTMPTSSSRTTRAAAGEELLRSSERTNDLNISLESVTSTLSSAKKSSRRRHKRSDPSQCLEIISMMYDRFYQQEEVHLIGPYIHKHQDINQKMRSILVDWLVEVHFKFRLQTPTLWLCVNIMDRYLTCRLLQRNKLQLLGVSSLLIACKFEEIFPPEVQDCVYITDRAYSKDEVLTMEKEILRTLDYQLCVPTGYTFLMRYLNLIHASEILKNLSFYYAERNLQEPDSLSVKPSLFAAAALYAALVQQAEHSSIHSHDTVNEDNDQISLWPDILIEESDYDEMDLLPIAKRIILHVSEEPVTTSLRRLVSTKKKYLNDKFLHIADFSLPTFTIQIRRQIQPLIE